MRTDDGGWRGDGPLGHLELTPEHFAAVAREHQAALDAKNVSGLDDSLKSVLSDSSQSSGWWSRQDDSVKSLDSLARKSATGDLTPEEIERNGDTNRFTRTYEASDYTQGVRDDIAALEADDRFTLFSDPKNYWNNDANKGINASFFDHETERRFEIQFHTKESLSATDATHGIYEYKRQLSSTAEQERNICDAIQAQTLKDKNVKTPEGAEHIGRPPETVGSVSTEFSAEEIAAVRSRADDFIASMRASSKGPDADLDQAMDRAGQAQIASGVDDGSAPTRTDPTRALGNEQIEQPGQDNRGID